LHGKGCRMTSTTFLSIFSPRTAVERDANFATYFEFSKRLSGELIETEKDLTIKRARLKYFQDHPVRSRRPLAEPDSFYRNYVKLIDDPKRLDRKTLLLCCVYKFARHELVGISGAWDAVRPISKARNIIEKITRYHLAEEFCHVRFFHEMFRTMQLDRVEWKPLGPFMSAIYRLFPYFPDALLDAPAFVTELMGIVFYRHVDNVLDEIFADEPEARDRIRNLLYEIMIDELAHVGQRRNFIGPWGIKFARRIVKPLFRSFFNDIPETKYIFDIDQMIADGVAFNYTGLPPGMVEKSWVPSYCQI
jgi:hypothetical protein